MLQRLIPRVLRGFLVGLLALPMFACVGVQQAQSEPVWHQYQPGKLDFEGPELSETGHLNPFIDFRIEVEFRKDDTVVPIRGFFAADGQAHETGADSGTVWRVRFTPPERGEWTYRARLFKQSDVIREWDGSFVVGRSNRNAPLFHRSGILRTKGRFFKFSGTGEYWLKGGANSPENLLGYADFDGTYRMQEDARDGEAAVGSELHTFDPHNGDWRESDPSWHGSKGKGLIGAINYLSDQGMNTAYFLTMNVGGDGKDVWPWADPGDPTRFDVSKLAQWEIVFDHMQRRGIALHIVLQETENELLLDGGDTGALRQLYFNEMIARFGHHPALFWNLGEENGPVHWRPEGQDDEQRKAMARHFAQHDPYGHPVLLHTHSEPDDKDVILSPLLGNDALDGLSFQVSDRTLVNAETRKWLRLASESNRPWAITMDEIGMWHTGARHDRDDPRHDSLRQHALWGHLLGGGGGVEWYFGARQDGNDLTTEDWRSRAELWRQTDVALRFFRQHVPFWKMEPCKGRAYCLKDHGQRYVIHLSQQTPALVAGDIAPGEYQFCTLDPITGGMSASPSVTIAQTGEIPPKLTASETDKVVLLLRASSQEGRTSCD